MGIDFYGYINSFNSSLRSKNEFADKGIFNVADRIHATPAGTFAEGFIFLDQQINDSVIASVDFDFNTLMPNVKNADVKDLVYSDGVISYTYTPDSLPMYVTDEYALCNDTYGIPVTDSLNREIIKVTGLEEGTYDIVFNDVVVGSYSETELANGINIATLETNPSYIQSKTVYDLVNSKMAKDYILRNIAYVERSFWSKVNLTDADACIEYFNQNYASSTDGRFVAYPENKAKQAAAIQEIAELEASAKSAAKPGTYQVEIRRH